jgi:precorrin-6A/cobalt-precorrin-6A reductase
LLPGLASLSRCPLAGERLLLAIGARQLARAVTLTQGALHHARLLPNPYGLQQAMAAGLAAERVACLRPTAEGRVEEALLLRWGITVVLARQSGGRAEAQWHQLANRRGCRLLLLRRPDASAGGELLSPAALMARLATWTAAG